MDWSMRVPCADCPFRRTGGIRLRPAQVREIAKMMLHSQGGVFPCHRTVDHDHRQATEEVHCAGALIFAEKNHTATQMMRIAERIGLYDPRTFSEAVQTEVFDDLWEMLQTHQEDQVTKKKRKDR